MLYTWNWYNIVMSTVIEKCIYKNTISQPPTYTICCNLTSLAELFSDVTSFIVFPDPPN